MTRIFKENGQAVFDPSYMPEALPHREKQYTLLKESIFDEINEKEFGIPILFGDSGTGKTTVLKKIIEEIKNEKFMRLGAKYINATTYSTSYTALREIASEIISVPERGYGADEIILKLYNRLDIEEMRYIVGIDDADELIRRERGKIIDILARIEESYNKRLIYPIIVLRKINILNGLPHHITSKLGGIRIEFSPYNKSQLKDILYERIKKGIVENGITENAIEAATFATEKIFIGNARELMYMIPKAGKIAENSGENRILTEYIRRAIYEMYTQRTQITAFSKYKEEYYKILWAISRVLKEKKDVYKLDTNILKEVYEIYKRNFMDDLTYDKLTEDILDLSKTTHDIISQDHGVLVFMSYPAEKLYESLTRKLFFSK